MAHAGAEQLVFEAQPGTPQEAMIACPYEDVFFGGARGGGKTFGMLGDWMSHADLYGRDASGIFFRRTYDELDEVQKKADRLFPLLGAEYKSQKRLWVWANGAELKMRYLDRDADADRYQGHEYTWECFEELTNWPSPEPIDKLLACLRSAAGVPTYFRATGNPGGVGHNWVKARYIDPAPPWVPFADPLTGRQRVFIPATLDDNPVLRDNDPDYWRRVEASASGNAELLKAWRHGIWDIVAGGMFDDLWDRARHVIEPFDIPASWHVNRSFDWGSSKPFSVGWWAESDGTTAPNGRTYPRGTVFRIAEWYGSAGRPNEGLKLLATEIAAGIKEREAGMIAAGRVKKVAPGPADTAIWDADPVVSTSIAQDMADKGVAWTRADKTPGSRKTGWERVRKYLKSALAWPMEEPGLLVFNTCTDWIRTVPVLPRDKVKTDDVDTKAEDHAGDETRYRILEVRRVLTAY
jgi:hypothetical protein